jgi:hypothetical protein
MIFVTQEDCPKGVVYNLFQLLVFYTMSVEFNDSSNRVCTLPLRKTLPEFIGF